MGKSKESKAQANLPESEEAQEILNRIKTKFETALVPIGIGAAQLKILVVKDIDMLIEKAAGDPKIKNLHLPYWARIWEASIVLASFISEQTLKKGASVLELGAGMGITGLFMAAWGNKVLLTDNNEDALLFTRVNILLNDLQNNASVMKLDWANPELGQQFDFIVGSEIVYDRNTFRYLIDIFRKHLKPTGTIFLAEGLRSGRQSSFFELLEKHFRYERRGLVMRSGDEQYRVFVYRAWHR